MVRSTKADKALHLNAAYRLLERKEELSEAARSLSREFDLSLRQAYRSGSVPASSQTTWLRDAQRLAHLKFVSTMRLIGSTTPSSRRRTTFWSLHENVFSVNW